MKLKLQFHASAENFDLAPQFVDLVEGSGETVHFGPIKMMVLLDDQPWKEIEGELRISEDTGMKMDAGMEASEATLTVKHGEET